MATPDTATPPDCENENIRSDSNFADIAEGPKGASLSLCDYTPTVKAYDSRDFLHSRGARHVRIMCEYLETQNRLRRQNVLGSILFFGSARGCDHDEWKRRMNSIEAEMSLPNGTDTRRAELEMQREKLLKVQWLCDYFDKVRELARRITEWCMSEEGRKAAGKIFASCPSPVTSEGYEIHDSAKFVKVGSEDPTPLVVCTGGGPGLMEAANKGCRDVPGGRSLGMGISLPFEPGLNKYVNRELAFEFHYFFTRKFWMVYIALGLVVMPGGLGTMDELMELLTLKQTGKVKRDVPIVLFGKDYWKNAINFQSMADAGTMDMKDVSLMLYTDDPAEAFEFIRSGLISDRIVCSTHKSLKKHV